MIELTGTRIVPTFLFEKKGFLKRKQAKTFIGFEQNQNEIESMVLNALRTLSQ